MVEANKTLENRENYLYIEVPNEFARDLLESRYAAAIKEILLQYIPDDFQLKFVILKTQRGRTSRSGPARNERRKFT